jgi:hypothetical protein
MNHTFEKISYDVAIDFILPRHYSGRKPQIKYAFGAFVDCELQAVVTYGVPASRSLCVGIMGEEFYDKVIELNRLIRLEEYSSPLSMLVSFSLRELKKHNLLVVSYSDLSMNHHGAIYQACNFLFTGTTKERTDKYTEGNKHSRHYTNENNHLRKVRSSKHRYIYITANKHHKKLYMSKLNYPILEYPKGDKSLYKLGEYQKQLILNKDTGEYFYEGLDKV